MAQLRADTEKIILERGYTGATARAIRIAAGIETPPEDEKRLAQIVLVIVAVFALTIAALLAFDWILTRLIDLIQSMNISPSRA